MKRTSLMFYLCAALAITACKHKAEVKKEKLLISVDVLIAGKTDFPTSIEVNGSVLSEEMVELHPEVSGRLTFLNMPDGASVSEGAVLAKINDADLQAQLEQQKVQLELAMKTEQRLRKLLAVNGVNQSDYDVALSQVNSIQANIKVLNAQIDKTVIRAPFAGKLGLRLVSQGAYVTPQNVIGTLQQSDKTKIDFTVPESYSGLVTVGSAVSIQANGSSEKLLAEVSAIEPQINVESRSLKIRARLKNGSVNPGAFVKVLLDSKSQGIVVPSNAIIPDARASQVVVVRNKKAVFVNVETGERNADGVELTSGVNAGDTIVVSGMLFVRPNAVVKIRKVNMSAAACNLQSK